MFLELTNDQWVDLIRLDGKWLPGCCANVSEIREVLISVLRNGTPFIISKYYAEKILGNLTGHEIESAFEPEYISKASNDPWPAIADVCLKSAQVASLADFMKRNII